MSDRPIPLKRKRGRPKGSKSKPKTISKFISDALASPYQPPAPRKPSNTHGKGKWAQLKTPEERSAYAKLLRSKVTKEGLARSGRKEGVPNGWTAKAYAAAEEQAASEAQAMLRKMEAKGLLTEDAMMKTATLECLKLLRAPASRRFHLQVAKTLLEHFHAKPVQRSVKRVNIAEKMLDELNREGK